MRVKGCSPSTVRQTYTVLRSVLETAVRDDLLAGNPAATVKRPGVPRTEAHYLSIAEVASLLEAVKDSRYAPLLRLLVATGLRRGEALALRWSDVALTNGLLRLRGTRANGHVVISEPKTERSRRDVPLSPATVALLGGSRQAKRSSGSRRPRSGLRRASCSPRGAGRQSTQERTAGDQRRGQGLGHQRCRAAQVEARHAHARGRRATAYRLGATRALLRRGHRRRVRPRLHRGRALRRPAALSSNGLLRVCAVATPLLHFGLQAGKRPPRVLSETASDLLFPVGMTGFEPAAP